MSNFKRSISLFGLKIKKHSPEILVVAGAAGSVGAMVMACRATTKLDETLDICKARKNEVMEFEPLNEDEEKQQKKELCKVTVKNVWDITKLYAPAVITEVASLSIIFASNGIQRKRNASLAAAYTTLDSMFKAYRKNVVETYGEDVDHDMRYGVNHEKIEVVEVDPETGKEKKVKKTIDVVGDVNEYSEYARFFDETCPTWDPCAEYNLATLKANQTYANNLLRAKGYLFLNDVYKIIGIPCSIAGQSVGWVYDPDNDAGDNYISFGIFEDKYKANRRFVNGLEPVILLDFNVDGDLLSNPKLNKLLNKKIGK